jgi:hypothetical protein
MYIRVSKSINWPKSKSRQVAFTWTLLGTSHTRTSAIITVNQSDKVLFEKNMAFVSVEVATG